MLVQDYQDLEVQKGFNCVTYDNSSLTFLAKALLIFPTPSLNVYVPDLQLPQHLKYTML